MNKYLSCDDPSKPRDERKMSTCTNSDESVDIEGFNEGVEQFVESSMVPQAISVDEVLSLDRQNLDPTSLGDEGKMFHLVDFIINLICFQKRPVHTLPLKFYDLYVDAVVGAL